MGIGNGEGQTHRPQQRYIWHIVADKGALRGGHIQLRSQFAEVTHLVAASLDHVADAKFPAASGHCPRAASREDGNGNAGARQGFEPVAVLDVEALQRLAARPVIHAPIREDAVNIQNQQANRGQGCFAAWQGQLLHHACAQQVVRIEGAEQALILGDQQRGDTMLIHEVHALRGELMRADGAAAGGHHVLHE